MDDVLARRVRQLEADLESLRLAVGHTSLHGSTHEISQGDEYRPAVMNQATLLARERAINFSTGLTATLDTANKRINVVTNLAVGQIPTDLLTYTDTQLTNAQVLALRAAPITLVAAPAANFAIVVDNVFFYFDSAGAYTLAADRDLTVEYASGADIMVVESTGFLDQATDQARVASANYPEATPFTPIAASLVRLFNPGAAELGGGNAANTLSVRVYYHVVDMAAFT